MEFQLEKYKNMIIFRFSEMSEVKFGNFVKIEK